MSRIDELIKQFCANGVPYMSVDEIFSISRGKVISKDYIKENAGDYPVFSSQTENNGILGFISTYAYDGEYLTWTTDGANAGTVFYRTGKFSVTNVCGLLEVKDKSILNARFGYYVLNMVAPDYVNRGMGNPKLMSNVMGKIKLPIPSIQVQEEIVRILDNFTDLTAELQAELKLRNKQYEEIAYRLLFDNHESEKRQIKDICIITKGKSPIQKTEPGEYPMVVTTSERKSSSTYQFDDAAVCIPLVSSRGHGVASLNHVYYQEGKFALGNILCAIVSKNDNYVSMKYLYHYFECTKDYTLVPLMKGGANVSMHIPDIEKVRVPIPSIEKQKEIISTLEILGKYCFELLPAEIEARQKQYEFYRKKLLTFKEAV